jgi:hypothetical protein
VIRVRIPYDALNNNDMINIVMFKNDSGDRPRALFYITKKTSTSVIENTVKSLIGDDYIKKEDVICGQWWFQEVKHIDDIK